MKNSNILLIAVILFLVSSLGYILLNQGKGNAHLEDNELIVNNFEYTYDGTVSHICPGKKEIFEFSYDGISVLVISQAKNFIEGRDNLIEDYPECENKGSLVNFYDNSEGISNIPDSCEILEQKPSNQDKPEFLKIKCNSQIKFNILDIDKFNSCISEKTCILINGADVEFQ